MTLRNEKAKVMVDINDWIDPIMEDKTILTANMLDAIIAKCKHLKMTDF